MLLVNRCLSDHERSLPPVVGAAPGDSVLACILMNEFLIAELILPVPEHSRDILQTEGHSPFLRQTVNWKS